MSTKCSLSYSHDPEHSFHFYTELFDEDAVFLELRGKAAEQFQASPDSITVRIPREIWEVIRLRGGEPLQMADWTNEQIREFVVREVDQRIDEYQARTKLGEKKDILAFVGSACYGIASEPREDQIRQGIQWWTTEVERQTRIKRQSEAINREMEAR